MTRTINRRTFSKQAAALGALAALPASASALGSNDRVRLGFIGVGNRGDQLLDAFLVHKDAEVVALCDVYQPYLDAALKKVGGSPRLHRDYRRLLEQKDIDAVVVATPDHTHAVATVAALQAGKHVYCEKPLTHRVDEARIVAEMAAKHRRVTQMGTQIHAGDNYRRVVELVQAGAIGTVKEVHVWCGASRGGGERPKDTPPVPAGLHWDLWLGPAPERPYHPTYVPFYWRHWWDFGGGTLADMACHHTDLPFWALKLRSPTTVAAEGPPPHPETAARELTVHYEYPARAELPPVKLTWYDGGRRPPQFAEGLLPRWGDGTLFVGSKGMLLADYGKHLLLPQKQFEGFSRPKPTIPSSIGHHKEWVEACKTGGTTTCNFDYAGTLTEAALLGNVSYRLGRPLTWDAKNLRAVNEPEADRFLRHHYRAGWKLV